MRLVSAIATLLLLGAIVLAARSRNSEPVQGPTHITGSVWVKLTFGLDGKAVSWDGSVVIRDGRILQTAPWSFEKRDRFDSKTHKWTCTTAVLKGRSASSFAEPQRGVLLDIEALSQAQLAVETTQGSFNVNIDGLEAGRPQLYLGGRASAELLASSTSLPKMKQADQDVSTDDDFPSLAIDSQGHRWVAWIGYEDAAKRDHLWVLDLDAPNGATEEIVTAREQLDPKLVTDADGNLHLFWAAPVDANWEIWMAKRDGKGWTVPQRITHSEGTDFCLATARGPSGDIWLAWQAFRGDNSDILVKRLSRSGWSPELTVAHSDVNDWEPAISIDPTGRAWIAYDSYQNGNYDVFLTSVVPETSGTALRQGTTIPVAATAEFEAHASVEATDGKTVWVAYDVAGPNWGKDFTRDYTNFKGNYGETLHGSRRLELRAFVDGQVMSPKTPLPQKLNRIHPRKISHSDTDEYKRFYELPHLVRDGSNRLWLFFRLNRQGYAGHPRMGANWEFFATTFIDGNWIEPILLPLSTGRQNQEVSTCVDATGRIQVAWSTGDHLVNAPQRVRLGRLPDVTGKQTELALVPAPTGRMTTAPEPIVRSWKVHRRDQTFQVYFGDLHRHTDISLCTPTADGCLVDAYRYALDAVRLDFLAITDHTRDTDPYPWWRTQKANDLFYVKGRFAPIYGYERSNSIVGGGHRNVFFLERGWPVFRSDAHYSYIRGPRPANNNPDVALYPHLRGKNAFTAAHTPGYSRKAKRGTWTYHDPQVEPLAEIIQTYRHDYERPGPPQWRDARARYNVAEEASLWYALARGYQLGFIASSDHHATHTSFACVWATGPRREQIFDGLRSRRTYAATDKIILDVRMGDALMGERIEAPDLPELSIHVRGTDVIDEIQVVRNRTILAKMTPGKREVRTSFRDTQYPGGAAYYYVRIRQHDNNMAWGSPIWVR